MRISIRMHISSWHCGTLEGKRETIFGRFSVSTPHAYFKLFRRLLCPDWTLTGSALGKLAPVPWLCVLLAIAGGAFGW